jgi:glutaredoxin
MKLTAKILICAALPAMFMANQAQAQMYKWVGPDGKVTYSDQPPPANQKKVEQKNLSSGADVSNLPSDLALVVAKNPVSLYTTTNCPPCDSGRSFLKTNGVPFSEKTVGNAADAEKLKQVGGDSQLPLMVIANVKFHGFNNEDWKTAISSAGYPATSKLPKDYRYPAPEPAAPPPPAPAAKEANTPKPPVTPPPAKPATDNGIRF